MVHILLLQCTWYNIMCYFLAIYRPEFENVFSVSSAKLRV